MMRPFENTDSIVDRILKQWQKDVDAYRAMATDAKKELEEYRKFKEERDLLLFRLGKAEQNIAELERERQELREEMENNQQKTADFLEEVEELDGEEIEVVEYEPKQESALADICIDYSILYPVQGLDSIEIFGNLHMRNSGNVHLMDPMICFRMQPPEGVSISGKILPPKLAETMGVYSSEDGLEGWVFADNEKTTWFEEAKQRGEYWVRPLHTVRLSPGESLILDGIQLTLQKPDERKRWTLQAVVYFNRQKYHFASRNMMSLQFVSSLKEFN